MFRVSQQYSRRDIFELLGVAENARAGDWFTGYHKHNGEWFIFTGVGTGRTGHDHGNEWVGNQLLWRGKPNSRRGQPVIQELTSGRCPVRIFWRTDDRAPFTNAGLAEVVEVRDTLPVTVLWRFDIPGQVPEGALPDEVRAGAGLVEGAIRSITVNAYERNPAARRQCLAHHGFDCSVCGFNFGAAYGDQGLGYIHVHHIRPLADVGAEYVVDPVKDLRPVCPNCHAMIHRQSPALSIEELRSLLKGREK